MNETLIGGQFCKDEIEPGLIPAASQVLTEHERDLLWRLFTEIGEHWENVYEDRRRGVFDSSNLRSAWLEFIEAKTTQEPRYTAEYSNAATAIEELIDDYGEQEAFRLLFFEHGIPDGLPTTRVAHAKRYVVDEFIRVQIIASGHKKFKANNYRGYIGGSRYTRTSRVTAYQPDKDAS